MLITLRLPCANPEFAELLKAELEQLAIVVGSTSGMAASVEGRYVLIPWTGQTAELPWDLAEIAESWGYADEFEVAQFAADAEKAATS